MLLQFIAYSSVQAFTTLRSEPILKEIFYIFSLKIREFLSQYLFKAKKQLKIECDSLNTHSKNTAPRCQIN